MSKDYCFWGAVVYTLNSPINNREDLMTGPLEKLSSLMQLQNSWHKS